MIDTTPLRKRAAVTVLAAVLALTGCTNSPDASTLTPAPATPTLSPSVGPSPSAGTEASPTPVPRFEDSIEGTVVRFTTGQTTVEVTMGSNNPTVRDFLSLLPTTTAFEEFAGREKIGYLPRELTVSGSPGSDPVDGDLIYFVPWGNLGFYYNTEGIGYSDQTIHLGTYTATPAELAAFDGANVAIEIVAVAK